MPIAKDRGHFPRLPGPFGAERPWSPARLSGGVGPPGASAGPKYLLHKPLGSSWAFGGVHRLARFGRLSLRSSGFTGLFVRSSCNWKFCRLSPPRLMSYLPVLSFGPSPLPGNTPSADFCLMINWPFDHPSRRGNMRQISWGKFSRLPCTTAESTPCLMETDFAARCPLVRRSRLVFGSCPSARTFAPRFLQTPPRGDSPCASLTLTLHLHQVGYRTCASKLLNMPGTQRSRYRGVNGEVA